MDNGEKQTKVGGLRAIELYYRPVREIATGNTAFYQSRTQLNTPELGTLLPENYRDFADLSMQCKKLFPYEVIQTMEANAIFTERELNFSWISVYMPVPVLLEPGTERALTALCDKYETASSRICFSLPDKLLMETDGKAAATIQNLRNRGFHFMLTNFGGDVCPLMRLAQFPVDYVLLSQEVTHYIGGGERSDNAVHSLIGFVNDVGSEPVADGVVNSRQAEALYSFGCNYCAGELSGKYVSERYVRRNRE